MRQVSNRLWLGPLLALCLAACSDSDGARKADSGNEPDGSSQGDATTEPDGEVANADDASVDGAMPEADGGTDAGTEAGLTPCLDQPGELPRAPNGQLPCELLPPGFGR